jgi:hypothetical protein
VVSVSTTPARRVTTFSAVSNRLRVPVTKSWLRVIAVVS